MFFKKALFIFLIATAITGTTSYFLFAQIEPNKMCPVMANERTSEKFHTDYEGKRIYFCCRQCVKSFKKNPKKYLPQLAHS